MTKLRMHFYSTEPFTICTEMRSVSGRGCKCYFLKQVRSGWYACDGFGFRYRSVCPDGISDRNDYKVLYDEDFLLNGKRKKLNFCIYRFLGIALLLWKPLKIILNHLLKMMKISK